ncbi:hypothetical protein SEA_TILLUMS_31 [Arthrobacter phage Tillums]|nr:hypothetical protein SEA_TILLUMS_31 [Arthrobacter phage Tillums]
MTCKHCELYIEQLPSGNWMHTKLSIYCPGSTQHFIAQPKD